jgi:hypothetical protein
MVGAVALFAVAYGGFKYTTSGGGSGVSDAKAWIFAGLSGVVLLICSWLILYTINPALVSYKEPSLPQIEIDIPEPPMQIILNLGQQTGALPSSLTFSNSKYPDMEQRFNATAPNNLRQVVSGLPLPSAITSYDQGSGHVPNSDHYQQKAVDIYIGNLTNDQVRTLMTYLNNNPNVSKTIQARLPEMNMLFVKQHDYGAKTLYGNGSPGSKGHTTHIHVSVY